MDGFDKWNDLVLNGALETHHYTQPLTYQYAKPLLSVWGRGGWLSIPLFREAEAESVCFRSHL